MNNTALYEGYVIQSVPRYPAEREQWPFCVVISFSHCREMRPREFSSKIFYLTEQEVDTHGNCLQHVGDCGSRGGTRTKGPCTKQKLLHIISEFRRKNPRASIPQTVFPEPYLLTETENRIIDDILALLNKHGLTLYQSQNLLERLSRTIEMGQRVAKGATHEQGDC